MSMWRMCFYFLPKPGSFWLYSKAVVCKRPHVRVQLLVMTGWPNIRFLSQISSNYIDRKWKMYIESLWIMHFNFPKLPNLSRWTLVLLPRNSMIIWNGIWRLHLPCHHSKLARANHCVDRVTLVVYSRLLPLNSCATLTIFFKRTVAA